MCRFCSCWFHFAAVTHIQVIVSHVISIVDVIISLCKGNSIVSVIWVCCPCAALFLLVKSVTFKYSLVPNRRGVGIVGGWKNPQNLISGGGWNKRGVLENCLKI